MTQDDTSAEWDFPITDYYKHHILDGQTLNHSGTWWTAILLLEEPKNKKPFIALYRWQKTEQGWKTRKRFSFKRAHEVKEAVTIIQRLAFRLE